MKAYDSNTASKSADVSVHQESHAYQFLLWEVVAPGEYAAFFAQKRMVRPGLQLR